MILHSPNLLGVSINQLKECLPIHRSTDNVSFLRESIAQMIQGGQRVIDNPVYLSDLGES